MAAQPARTQHGTYAPEDCVLVVDELVGNICGLQDRAVEEPSRALVDEHVRDRITPSRHAEDRYV